MDNPEKLIVSTIEHTKKIVTNNLIKETTTDTKFVAMPYVQGAFEKIKNAFNKHNIKVVGRGDHNLKKYLFSTIKDKIPITQQSNVIYKITSSCVQMCT